MVRQSGFGRSQRIVAPVSPDGAGIDVKTKSQTFWYWTVSGQKRSARGDTSGRIQFDPPLRSIAQAMGGLDEYTKAAARQRMQIEAEVIQEEMQQNAPWEDRGGTARESLFARVTESANKLAIVAGYDVDYLMTFQLRDRVNGTWPRNYSVFLETMQGGRFAIVKPTLEQQYGDFMGIFVEMWREGNRINEGFSSRQQRKAEDAYKKARISQIRAGHG